MLALDRRVQAFCVLSAALAHGAPAREQALERAADSPTRGASQAPKTEGSRRLPESLRFANGLLKERKYELAAEEYERFLQAGASGLDAADARFGLATARLYQARYPASLASFDEFLKTAPDDPRVATARYRVGELSYLTGDLAAARRSLETFTGSKAEHPGHEMAWAYLGDACFGLGDFAAARRAYESSLERFPHGRMAGRARYGLGRTLAELGEREKAIETLQPLVAPGQPDWVDRAWLQIGLIRHAAGQYAGALEAFTTLERVAPQSPFKEQSQLNRALALARLDRGDESEDLLRAIARDSRSPSGAQAALELATIELEHEHADRALATVEEALKRFPKAPAVPALHFRAAEALAKQNRTQAARSRFLRVMELDASDPWADDATQRAAQLCIDSGDPAQARHLANQFAARFPNSPLLADVRLIEARAATMLGKPDDAITILEALLAAPTADRKAAPATLSPAAIPVARYELALAYRAVGQTNKADAMLVELAQGPPNPVVADAQFLVGQTNLESGKFAAAIPALERYVSANPRGEVLDFAMAHLAMAHLGLGDLDEARKLLASAAERFPSSKALPRAHLRLGEAELAAHHADRAAEQFRKAADVQPAKTEPGPPDARSPNEPNDDTLRVRALAGLGKSLTELGKPAEAARAFQSARELAGSGPLAAPIALAEAQALEASRQPEPALHAYAQIALKFPNSDQSARAYLATARLLAKSGDHQRSAQEYQRLSRDDAACRHLASAGVARDTILAEWAYALLDAEKPAEADHVFEQLLKDHPASPLADDARFNLAESANQKHDLAAVVRLLAPISARKSDGPTNGKLLSAVLYRLGRTQIELKDYAAAQATFDQLLASCPESTYQRESRYLRAEAALRQGDAATAETGLAALLSQPPAASDPPGMIAVLKLKRIQCLVALKRWNEANALATAVQSELKPGDQALAELDYARGQALLGLGRLADARAAFQKVLDARGTGDLAAQAQLMRGETYFHADQLHEALREFLKVDILYKAPHWQALALLEAGKVYERLDQWADAAETYERLLKKFPSDPIAGEARKRRDATTRRVAPTASPKKS